MFNSPNKSVGVINGVPDFPADGNDYVFQGDNTWKVLPPPPGKNLIINGAMNIAQRGTQKTGVTTAGYYTCDRWSFQSENNGTWTISQNDTSGVAEFPFSFKATCTTSQSSGTHTIIRQSIETQNILQLVYGTSEAKPLTVSFWVKSNKTGTACFRIQTIGSSNSDYSLYCVDYPISSANTWEHKVITIPGNQIKSHDTTRLNLVGIHLDWYVQNNNLGNYPANTWVDSASGATSSLGLGGTVGDYIELTGVQLEVGDEATEFEYEDYGTTLAKCQRYYQTYKEDSFTWSGATVTGKSFQTMVSLPVKMRDKPSATVKNSTSHEGFANGATVFAHSSESIGGSAVPTAAAGRGYYYFGFTADAEL